MRNNGFMAGMVTGVTLGALMVLAMSPQVRGPVMDTSREMGNRMRKMWRRGTDMAEDMLPEGMQ